MPNDMLIQQAVLTEIDHDPVVPDGSVGVEVHHGVVKLAGHESDTRIKEHAELAARRVEGVTHIVLDLGS